LLNVQTLGGVVETVETDGEYGRTSIRTTQASELYREETDHAQQVWMSHGDKAVRLPDGFQPVATSEKVPPAC
jgi:GMP synthase (glutamine-hydrolysing)